MKEVSINELKNIGTKFIVKDIPTGHEARLRVHRIVGDTLQAKRISDDAYFDFNLSKPLEETKFYLF